jgi:NAD(P)-dependent dehydrogenase (short-subunit alcohol dehydrogenase family)
VNAAGIIGDNMPTADSSLEAFDKVNSVNYRGLWMCVREEIRMMKNQELSQEGVRGQRGSIVNIASQLGVVGRPKACTYTQLGTADR